MNNLIAIRIKLIIIFAILLLNTNCVQKNGNNCIESKTEKEQDTTVSHTILWDTVTIKDLIYLLGKTIDTLPNIKKYKQEKIIIEDDEEYAPNWFGVKYLYRNQLMFIAETNWENKNIVSRVTLYSNEIKEGKLYVGQIFGNIRNLVSNKIPTSPDGELCVILNKYPEITLQLDISNVPDTSPLYYGGVSVSEIPDNLKIALILIMKK